MVSINSCQYPPFQDFAWRNDYLSSYKSFRQRQSNSISLDLIDNRLLIDAFVEISQIYNECREDNWDGYGSLAISPAVVNEAIRFIDVLPQGIPLPEIVPEPAGDIGFEWNYGKNRVFVASVSGTNYISYAGLFGIGVKTHGTEVFSNSIAQVIIYHISRISQAS